MAYNPPAITAAGLTIALYPDILADNLTQTQSIYGQNIYLGKDNPLYQLLSVISAKQADSNLGLQLVYDSRSTQTAIGAALDSLGKLIGPVRGSAFPSTCVVTLSGSPNAVIAQGVIRDVNGILWDLPANTVISNSGTATATATCETPGPIAANVSTLTGINSPQAGWTSVTNASPAIVGEGVETDSAYRAQLAISNSLPALTTLASTEASVAATPGVTRYNVVENFTGSVDSNGNPAHSLTAVVEGGTDLAVATAIYGKHGIGCDTNGSTSVVVTDPFNGSTTTISFDRPSYQPIFVTMTVHGLAGYTSSVLTAIQNAIVNYLQSLQIGEEVTFSAMYGVALSVMPNLAQPQFSVKSVALGTSASPTGTSDIVLTFNEVSYGSASNILVTAV
jgi:uncharacterized phage protein gp47/JayE